LADCGSRLQGQHHPDELWLKDPDGTLIEIYARLTDRELAAKPADEMPQYLVRGTEPAAA
jgi:hypothetical protein